MRREWRRAKAACSHRPHMLLWVVVLASVAFSSPPNAQGGAGSLAFSGPDPTAALFTLEVKNSFAGVLEYDYFENETAVHTGGNAGKLTLAPCAAAAPAQLWPWPPRNSSAPLQLAATGDCVDCRNDATHHCQPGDDVQLYTCLGTPNQRWQVKPCPSAETFQLVSEKSGACLAPAGSTGSEPAMAECSCNKGAWRAVPAAKTPGNARLQAVRGTPALCLVGTSSGSGTGTTMSFPAGYVQASPAGQGWSGSMWPRDGGAFLRELIMFGDFGTAVVHSRCMLRLLTSNERGFFALPEHFEGVVPSGTLTAEEGTAALVMNIVMLWQRLCHAQVAAHVDACAEWVSFLSSPHSPVEFWHQTLLDHNNDESAIQNEPHGKQQHAGLDETRVSPNTSVGLVPGSGEFGGGCCAVPGIDSWLYYNSVQNSAVANALRAASAFEATRGNRTAAERHAATAAELRRKLEALLTNETDGGWVWAINTTTLRPDALILSNPANIGFAGINELQAGLNDGPVAEWVAAPACSSWPAGVARANRTFYRLLETPLRKQLWEEYGIYTQFDVLKQDGLPGHGSSAYGHDYALQVMLLQDELGMAARALRLLANITVDAGQHYSKYNFFEQFSVPKTPNQARAGCGELNLVNAMAPIKVARLVFGLDDTNPKETILRPRLPPGWSQAVATNWPVLVAGRNGLQTVRISVTVTADSEGGATDFVVKVEEGESLPALCVRLGSAEKGYHWQNQTRVAST
eukprot:SAG31_NODE_920_length_10987_cov_4.682757_3_plen_744_part_00